jgi:hypothetical protein
MAGGMAILAFIIGMAVTWPAMVRAGELGAQDASAPDDATRQRIARDLDAARKRGMLGGTLVLLLLVMAVVGMAVARYTG